MRTEITALRLLLTVILLVDSAATVADENHPDRVANSSVARTERPNVIVIMSDDQGGGDYGFMGNKVIRTPQLDALSEKSGLLSRFYVSPVCAPTRASLMTGRYNYRTRCIDTYVGRAMMDPAEITIAEMLGEARIPNWHLRQVAPGRQLSDATDGPGLPGESCTSRRRNRSAI